MGFVLDGPASSRASPLPQVSALTKKFVNDTDHCGSGLARDEAPKNTLLFPVKSHRIRSSFSRRRELYIVSEPNLFYRFSKSKAAVVH